MVRSNSEAVDVRKPALQPHPICAKALVCKFVITVPVGFGLKTDSRPCVLKGDRSRRYGAALGPNSAEHGAGLKLCHYKRRKSDETQ